MAVASWSATEVQDWLVSLGVGAGLLPHFLEVDGAKLTTLQLNDLVNKPYELSFADARRVVEEVQKKEAASALDDVFDAIGEFDPELLNFQMPDFGTGTDNADIAAPGGDDFSAPPPPAPAAPAAPTATPKSAKDQLDDLFADIAGLDLGAGADDAAEKQATQAVMVLDPIAQKFIPGFSAPALPSERIVDLHQLVQMIKSTGTVLWSPQMIDYWTSLDDLFEQWVPDPPYDLFTNGMQVVDAQLRTQGFNVEYDANCCTHTIKFAPDHVVNAQLDFPWYKEFIAATPHANYCAMENGLPIVVSVQTCTGKDTTCCRAIVRTEQTDKRVLLPSNLKPTDISALILREGRQLVKMKSPTAVQDLSDFEVKSISSQYKFGVLYCKPHQKTEADIFNNCEGTPQYEEFLAFLGTKITLKGWQKYRGGLDVKYDNSGTHSVYTTLKNIEVMFHVATMLPCVEHDPSRIERKRHTGNDVVVIIFKEQGDDMDTFSPKILNSHFNHCFFVITPIIDACGKTTHYKFACCSIVFLYST
eukprot:TRINITY_DN2623_c0_g1_i1.p1 TRINITY_DN2623_c0_g1~~TRINITY_DN2623_c0_g1_i1.p1  ORF type:complete len:531 (-),score=129.86 TRINITY_DN2623_c0_g1_i1:2102-3694(-)